MRNWTPILSPSSALFEEAIHVVDNIAARCCSHLDSPSAEGASNFELALLFGYLAKIRNSQEWLDRAAWYLDNRIDFAKVAQNPGLRGGLAGLGWLIEHLSRLLAGMAPVEETEDGDLCCQLDSLLVGQLESGVWQGPLDLANGLSGVGLYFIERLPSERAALGLELVIYHLEKAAAETPDGIEWGMERSSTENSVQMLEQLAGLLCILIEASRANAAKEQAERMLAGAMQSLMRSTRESSSTPANLSLFKGDSGLAAACLAAALHAARDDWNELAGELFDRCFDGLQQSLPATDLSLGGALGVAHTFSRVHQIDADPRYADAARRAIENALCAIRCDTANLDLSLEHGLCGIALALLGATSTVEPQWDRFIMPSFALAAQIQLNSKS